ncbi:MAG: 2-oxoacid:ferredoxin oxidoreductase subunit beta [Gemmatimonadetes bacterium]|nr:2-oxoacid:ferredoxin oxidoreductase subunit beta [Gemmatimonadota bacterium]MDA1102507.1 2-oxoacid:ferredoxin oxidoreductase subunit beta [Gemmatimonadota bacterium]
MSYIAKPSARHPKMPVNALGLTARDYEGSMSTLCAGCGHDSVTAALVQTFFELDVQPHLVGKLSGIGCSSKTPAYFMSEAHGFNSVHGRMPAIAAGANAANRDLLYVGISGDGDSLSIGLGQFCHAVRRNVDMVYVLENNGVYGLTKGQFSASADVGSRSKTGEVNGQGPIDPVNVALTLGATFVARSFSGDKQQLVPILKAAFSHKGFAFVDVISPCVTFNDHKGSTKSYAHTRSHMHEVIETDFVPLRAEIKTEYAEGSARAVRMHDGSVIRLRKVAEGYDPTDRAAVIEYLGSVARRGEISTGLLYVGEAGLDMHDHANTTDTALVNLGYETLCPGSQTLADLQKEWR